MRKNIVYVLLTFFECILALTYGLFLQNIISVDFCMSIAFIVPCAVLCVFFKNEKKTIKEKLIKTIGISILCFLLFIAIFFSINRISGELVDEYVVAVERIDGRGGDTVYFTTPDGEYGEAELHNYGIIFPDEDDYVDVGDKIRVREYRGFLNTVFYVFVEEVH